MFGRPVTKSCRCPPGGMRETRALVPIGPVPPKLTGSGTMTSPGLPASATYSVPSGANAMPFGFTSPLAYTSTCVVAWAEADPVQLSSASATRVNPDPNPQRYKATQPYPTHEPRDSPLPIVAGSRYSDRCQRPGDAYVTVVQAYTRFMIDFFVPVG